MTLSEIKVQVLKFMKTVWEKTQPVLKTIRSVAVTAWERELQFYVLFWRYGKEHKPGTELDVNGQPAYIMDNKTVWWVVTNALNNRFLVSNMITILAMSAIVIAYSYSSVIATVVAVILIMTVVYLTFTRAYVETANDLFLIALYTVVKNKASEVDVLKAEKAAMVKDVKDLKKLTKKTVSKIETKIKKEKKKGKK